MPLQDHFHPPIADAFPWDAFHTAWANEIMRMLNRHLLPAGYYAAAQVHLGGSVEIDVATFEESTNPTDNGGALDHRGTAANGGVAVAAAAPARTVLSMPAVFPDVVEVQVYRRTSGHVLVGAIELVSPANKDRPTTRQAFIMKCASYLQQGIGLVTVDIVTQRTANLHDALVHLLEQPPTFAFPQQTALYAVAYHPQRHTAGDTIGMELVPLELGQPLPVMPLALRGDGILPIDLETTYSTTCVDCRL